MPFFQIGDTAVHVHEQGDRGTPVLCVHPPCISSRLFTYVRTELADTRRVITFDARGHGHSEAGTARLTLPLLAEDMRRILDWSGAKQAYLCAYGPASLPALQALLAYPDRFCGGILISGAAAYTDIVSRSKLQAAYVSSLLKARELVALQAAWQEADNRTAFQALQEEAKQGSAVRWKEYVSACLDTSFARELGRIRQPMLVIYGTADMRGAMYARELHRALPDSELYGVLKAGRHLLMKEPARTAFVIRQWIDKQERPEVADTFEEREELLKQIAGQGVTAGLEEEGPGVRQP
ncbi:alpha/beta fold hydrolase [Paenibacillus humicola]|uniref:alpha/beta fold hydrolase n=1 Tax=Paenibacillus humicola TaxID=3110540 RepID=UPI00237C2234|nr:alpha/beta hydrolase [Paenibacillus humicola]